MNISLIRVYLFLSISLFYVFKPTFSAPVFDIIDHEYGNQLLTTTEVPIISEVATGIALITSDQSIPDAHEIISPSYIPNAGDYIVSEREFADLLSRLQKEAEESVSSNPSNYANDNDDLTEILNSIGTLDSRDSSKSIQSPNSDDCPICLEPLDSSIPVKALPCVHKFHLDCIRNWATVHSMSWASMPMPCPICRHPFEKASLSQ